MGSIKDSSTALRNAEHGFIRTLKNIFKTETLYHNVLGKWDSNSFFNVREYERATEHLKFPHHFQFRKQFLFNLHTVYNFSFEDLNVRVDGLVR